MGESELAQLSRRERQIMDFLYQRERASVAEVMEGIEDPPSYSAVRAMLRTLEEKGRVKHVEDGRAYVNEPTMRKDAARQGALTHHHKTNNKKTTKQTDTTQHNHKKPNNSTAELD